LCSIKVIMMLVTICRVSVANGHEQQAQAVILSCLALLSQPNLWCCRHVCFCTAYVAKQSAANASC